MKECKCYAVATDPERLAMWKRIFPPDGHVPITCPIPVGVANLAGQRGEFYLVDLDRVSTGALEDLVYEMANKFDLAPTEVRKDIRESGIPVKADAVMISWCQIHSMAAMPDSAFEKPDNGEAEYSYDDDEDEV